MSTAAPLQRLASRLGTPSHSSHAGLLLQRKCACGAPTASLTGECAECKSKKRLQAKLAIGASHDPLEQEADRVAEQVMAAPVRSGISDAPVRIQRFSGQATGQADTAPASVDHVLASSGRPLEPALRQDMEQRFGHDFSRVRVHSDLAAEQSAREVNANAYTVGNDIVFGKGKFVPASHGGRRLLAHELTHVVQQSSETTPQAGPVGRALMSPKPSASSGSLNFSPSRNVLRRSVAGCQDLLNNPGPPVPPAAGTLIHRAILAFFLATVPGAVRIFIPGAAANPQRTGNGRTIPPEKGGGPQEGKGTPDLAALNAGGILQVAEIKPANLNQLLEGETQVASRYIDQGNASDEPQQAWRRSKGIKVVSPMLPQTFTPPSLFFPQGDYIIEVVFRWCQSGVLAYLLRAHRRPEENRVRERGRVPVPVPETNKGREESPQTARRPDELGHPGPAPTPLPTPNPTPGQSPSPIPQNEGGKVIPFPGKQSPGTQPDKEELPIAARSAGERILEFIAQILESGAAVEQAIEKFLKDNPEVLNNIKLAVAAIAAGAIVSDIISFGGAIAKDPAVLAILAAMLRIAEGLRAAAPAR